MRSTVKLFAKLPLYWCFRTLGRPILLPFNYTISVTYRCNSRCKTCKIWKIQYKIPVEMELTLDEWCKVLKSLGNSPYWITVSGGEPFLRKDLVEIIDIMDTYNKPKIINIPTNGLLWKIIPEKVKQILEVISPKTILIINFSLDGVGKDHDEIRGVPGNYSCLIKSYRETKRLKDKYCNLIVGIHTVISSWNVYKIPIIYETVMKELKPDQYITEIAEERNEMENQGCAITPSPEEFGKIVDFLITRIKDEFKIYGWRGLSTITQALRIQYYKLAKYYYQTKKQQIPSYAGYASAQISPTGDVWECAVYATLMGNLREYNYDFKKIWNSKKAWLVRKKVKESHPCPLANESYTNMLCNPLMLIKVLKELFI